MCKRRNLEGTTCIKSFYHHFPEKRRVKDFMMVKVKVKGDSGSSPVFSFNCANIYIPVAFHVQQYVVATKFPLFCRMFSARLSRTQR